MLQGFKKLETDQNRQDFGSASCVAMGLAEAQGLPCLPIRWAHVGGVARHGADQWRARGRDFDPKLSRWVCLKSHVPPKWQIKWGKSSKIMRNQQISGVAGSLWTNPNDREQKIGNSFQKKSRRIDEAVDLQDLQRLTSPTSPWGPGLPLHSWDEKPTWHGNVTCQVRKNHRGSMHLWHDTEALISNLTKCGDSHMSWQF